MTNWRIWALVGAVASLTPLAAQADCNIGDFYSRDAGSISSVQYLTYLSEISKEDWEAKKRSLSSNGNYYGISGGEDYAEMHNKVTVLLQKYNLQSGSTFSHSWATTALTDNGLIAYEKCVGGLTVTLASQDEFSAKLQIRWEPASGQSIPTPTILSSNNITNLKEIEDAIGQATWGGNPADKAIVVRKGQPADAADITIGGGPFSVVAYLPKPPPSDVKSDFPIGAKECDGPDDKQFCLWLQQQWVPADDSEILVNVSLPKIRFEVGDVSKGLDPHREGYVTVICGGLQDRPGVKWSGGIRGDNPLLGKKNSKSATDDYVESISCRGRKGIAIPIVVEVNPRAGTNMYSGSQGHISVLEIHH